MLASWPSVNTRVSEYMAAFLALGLLYHLGLLLRRKINRQGVAHG